MKVKISILLLVLIAGAAIYFLYVAKLAARPVVLTDNEIDAILFDYESKPSKELFPLTREIGKKLYGEWSVQDAAIGYSLKYRITGDQLSGGYLSVSEERFEEIIGSEVPLVRVYLSPVFVHYSETLGEMADDEFLNYSGIEGLDPQTIGTVVLGFAFEDDSPDDYILIPTKFILIDEYVIAFRDNSFFELEKVY